jgi:hypothetical protein
MIGFSAYDGDRLVGQIPYDGGFRKALRQAGM